MNYKEVNYKSDFDFILDLKQLDSDENIHSLGFPNYSFVIFLYTNSLYKYKVSYTIDNEGKETFINCRNINDSLQIIVEDHRLPKGQLIMDFYALLPNESYSDGFKTVVCNHLLPIKLTNECTQLSIEDITFIVPYIKGDKGDPLTWEDMTEQNKEEIYNNVLNDVRNIILTSLPVEDINDYNEITFKIN